MNEVKIVVTSEDRTNFGPIGAKVKKQFSGAVKESMKDVDKTVSTGMKESGEKAGKTFSHAIEDGLKDATHTVTMQVKQTVNGWDQVVTHKMRQVGTKGSLAMYESLGSSVSHVASLGQHMGQQTAGQFSAGLRGGLSTPVLGPIIAAALIGSVVALGPVVGALLAAGLVGAFGLGLAGIGMFFGAELKKVDGHWKIGVKSIREKAKALGKDIGDGFKEISKPFQRTWHSMLDTVRSVGGKFKPVLKDAFKDFVAPATTRFIKNLGLAFEELAPAVKPLSRAFADLMDELGPKLPTVFGEISDALIELSDTISANPELFANMIANIIRLIPLALRLLNKLAEIASWASDNSDWLKPLAAGALALGTALKPLVSLLDKVFGKETKKGKTPGYHLGDPTMPGTKDPKPSFMAKIGLDTSDIGRRMGVVNGQLRSFASKRWRTVLSATNLVGPAVAAGTALGRRFSRMSFRGKLTAVSLVSPIAGLAIAAGRRFARMSFRGKLRAISLVSPIAAIAIAVCRRFARGTYRASLRAVNQAGAAVRSALATAGRWAGRVFTAFLRTVKTGGKETGGIIGGATGMASGGIASMARSIGHAAEGGPRGALTMVGEAGPELVELPFGSRVRSNPDTGRIMAGAAGGGQQTLQVEWVGDNAGDELMRWLRKNIRIRAGSGPGSVQTALGG